MLGTVDVPSTAPAAWHQGEDGFPLHQLLSLDRRGTHSRFNSG